MFIGCIFAYIISSLNNNNYYYFENYSIQLLMGVCACAQRIFNLDNSYTIEMKIPEFSSHL